MRIHSEKAPVRGYEVLSCKRQELKSRYQKLQKTRRPKGYGTAGYQQKQGCRISQPML